MTTLKGKVALVTEVARYWCGDRQATSAGRCCRFHHLSVSHEDAKAVVHTIEMDGGRGMAIQADNADFNSVKASVAATVKAFGRLDVLVNNAATFHGATIFDFAIEEFDAMIAVNVKAVFVAIQGSAALGTGGRIINIGSVSSDYMPVSGGAVYAMTKGASLA